MSLVSERVGQYFVDDHRLEFTEYGGGDRWVVLVPGALMTRRMHAPLARRIAAAGAHVVTLDLLGHGRSDRPADPTAYSTTAFAEQVLALLDHLGADEAVLGGTSLGANVALEVAVGAPARVRGLLLEMPVLDNAVEAAILTLGPLLFVSRIAPVAVSGVGLLARSVPRRLVPFWAGVALDGLDQRPDALAATVHGIFFGRTAPPSRDRAAIEVPVLVIGHPHDPLHPLADALLLAEEVPGAVLLRSRGPLAGRIRPDRLLDEETVFALGCFEQAPRGRLVGS